MSIQKFLENFLCWIAGFYCFLTCFQMISINLFFFARIFFKLWKFELLSLILYLICVPKDSLAGCLIMKNSFMNRTFSTEFVLISLQSSSDRWFKLFAERIQFYWFNSNCIDANSNICGGFFVPDSIAAVNINNSFTAQPTAAFRFSFPSIGPATRYKSNILRGC